MEEDDKKVPEEDGISMLTRDLYARDESKELQQRTQDLLTPATPKVHPDAVVKKQPGLVNIMDAKSRRRRALLLWGGVVLCALIIFGAGTYVTLWYRSTKQVNESHVGLTVSAPAHFTAGGIMEYRLSLKNTSRVDWTTADLIFTPPVGFVYQESTPTGQVSEQNVAV